MKDEQLRLAYVRRMSAARPAGTACPAPEELLALVEKRGSEAERLAALDHAMSCDVCRRDLELLRSVESAGQTLGARQAARFPRWIAASPWRLAAAAVLVLAVGGVATHTLRRDDATQFRGPAGPLAVAPSGSVASGEGVRLTWRRVPTALRYQVELLGAAGDSVFAAATTDTTLALPPTATLVRGNQYLWSVRALFDDGTQAASAPLRFRVQP